MFKEPTSEYPEDKRALYPMLQEQLKALVEGIPQVIPNLANAAALLWLGLRDINWAGFYLMEDGQLVLGPFQGKPACIYIPVGKGVGASTTWTKRVSRDSFASLRRHVTGSAGTDKSQTADSTPNQMSHWNATECKMGSEVISQPAFAP